MKRVYISGRITGMDEKEAFQKFEEAQQYLESIGLAVVNPMKLPHKHDKTWEAYMKECIKAMMDCESIYMLDNWEQSRGARMEREIAQSLGMWVKYYFKPE